MTKLENSTLPSEYKMSLFPHHVDFNIPEFNKHYVKNGRNTLAIEEIDCDVWYNNFIDKVVDSCGKLYLPIYRMSDGEFLFLLGKHPKDIRIKLDPLQKIRLFLSDLSAWFKFRGGLGPFTQGHYQSGRYTKSEWAAAIIEQPLLLKKISEKGILALHLNYESLPFAERYFPSLNDWLLRNDISINSENYYPFYFVYAMLAGGRRGEILRGRNVLVVNGAMGEKKDKIVKGLFLEGVREVYWQEISLDRSLYDKINIEKFIGNVDLVLVGAGIGKAGILLQLEPLRVPCIDSGFMFEVWADKKNQYKRSYCAVDAEWEKVQSTPLLEGI